MDKAAGKRPVIEPPRPFKLFKHPKVYSVRHLVMICEEINREVEKEERVRIREATNMVSEGNKEVVSAEAIVEKLSRSWSPQDHELFIEALAKKYEEGRREEKGGSGGWKATPSFGMPPINKVVSAEAIVEKLSRSRSPQDHELFIEAPAKKYEEGCCEEKEDRGGWKATTSFGMPPINKGELSP